MANKILKTRIAHRFDTLQSWIDSTVILMAGEIAVADCGDNGIRIKVGDGTKTFAQLNWVHDVDLSNYITREELEEGLENYYTKTEIDAIVANYYTKQEAENTFTKQSEFNLYKEEVEKTYLKKSDYETPDLTPYETKAHAEETYATKAYVGTVPTEENFDAKGKTVVDYIVHRTSGIATDAVVESKADKAYVDAELAKKADKVELATYTIQKLESPEETAVATYALMETKNGATVQAGANINIPKDLVVQSGSYDAETGNIILVIANGDTIEIPAIGLVDVYTGTGPIAVSEGNVISLAHDGTLHVVDGKLSVNEIDYSKITGHPEIYTKDETDALLNAKADASSVHTKDEITNLLSTKADASNVYTKDEVNAELVKKANDADVYKKSEVYTKDEIATELNKFTKTESLGDLALKDEVAKENLTAELVTEIEGKANTTDLANYYTKEEADAQFEENLEYVYILCGGSTGNTNLPNVPNNWA